MEGAAAEDGGDEGLGGLTVEELEQGQETALALEDMMALSAQTLVRTEVGQLYQEVRPLGQGRFGRVLLVTHRQKGTGSWARECQRVDLSKISDELAKARESYNRESGLPSSLYF